MPASTMKLFTSAIALERFGPNYQFSTDALRDGPVGPDGTLNGNLYIRGDGDPALSGKFLPGGPSAPMNRLADLVAQQGIKHVTGSVVGDASGFDDQKIPDGWLTRYLQASYAARVSALSLNENLIAVAVTPTAGWITGDGRARAFHQRDSAGRERPHGGWHWGEAELQKARQWDDPGKRLHRHAGRNPQVRLHRRRSGELCDGRVPERAHRARRRSTRNRSANALPTATKVTGLRSPALAHDDRGDEPGEHQSLR